MSQTQFQDIDQSCQMEIWNEENGQSFWKIIATRISYLFYVAKKAKVCLKSRS